MALQRRRLLDMMEACPALQWLALESSLCYRGSREMEVEQLGPALQRLHTLQLWNYLLVLEDADVLERCIWLCPELQRFQYVAPPMAWAQTSPPMSVSLFLKALDPVKASLSFLELDLGYVCPEQVRDEYEHVHLVERLSAFTELEVLYLDEGSLCYPLPSDGDDADSDATNGLYVGSCIVEMLPMTVRRLGVRVLDGAMGMHNDIEGLGMKLREGVFMDLMQFELVIKSGDRFVGRSELVEEVDRLGYLLQSSFDRTSVAWNLRVQEIYGPSSFTYSRGGRLRRFPRDESIPDGWIGEGEWKAF